MSKLHKLAGGMFTTKVQAVPKFDEDLDLDKIIEDGDRKPAFGCPSMNY